MSDFNCPIKCDPISCDENLCPSYKAYQHGYFTALDDVDDEITSLLEDINLIEIKSHDDESLVEWIKSWKSAVKNSIKNLRG